MHEPQKESRPHPDLIVHSLRLPPESIEQFLTVAKKIGTLDEQGTDVLGLGVIDYNYVDIQLRSGDIFCHVLPSGEVSRLRMKIKSVRGKNIEYSSEYKNERPTKESKGSRFFWGSFLFRDKVDFPQNLRMTDAKDIAARLAISEYPFVINGGWVEVNFEDGLRVRWQAIPNGNGGIDVKRLFGTQGALANHNIDEISIPDEKELTEEKEVEYYKAIGHLKNLLDLYEFSFVIQPGAVVMEMKRDNLTTTFKLEQPRQGALEGLVRSLQATTPDREAQLIPVVPFTVTENLEK